MSKSLPLFVSAVGGVALLLGVAYGVTTRQYRDADRCEAEEAEATVAGHLQLLADHKVGR